MDWNNGHEAYEARQALANAQIQAFAVAGQIQNLSNLASETNLAPVPPEVDEIIEGIEDLLAWARKFQAELPICWVDKLTI